MPMYEYYCEKCDKLTEQLENFSDIRLTHCLDCKTPVERVFSKSLFQLKGRGWVSPGMYKSDKKK